MSVLPVRVAVRVRPLSEDESCQGCSSCLDSDPSEATVSVGKAKQFTFDFVFGGQPTDGELLYDQCVLPLLDGCFEGLNATVLAYGQTGSGKTFTMGTDGQAQGVIPKLIHDLFAKVEDAKSPDVEYNVQLSFLEIYREDIRDLLLTTPENPSLSLREDLSGSVFVCGLSKQVVCSEKDILDLITRGCKHRATASTSMNATSSRSHAIITIYIRVTKKESGEVRTSQFHLVDLAGSERAKRTHAQGSRFKEGVDINRGLLALGNVISALGDERKAKLGGGMHIPYRDSKLTRLLQDSLGGNARTVLIACASPADVNLDETMNTLKYANRARNIKNKPKANQEADNVSKVVQKLRDKISSLEAEVYALKRDRPLLPSQSKETCKTLLKLTQRNAVLEGLLEQLKGKGVTEVEDLLQESVEKDTLQCNDESSEMVPDEAEKEHLESQLNLQTQLQKVSEQLNIKLKASETMEETNKGMDAIRAAYEQTLSDLSNDLCVLQREREDLKARLEKGERDGNPKPELAKSREHSRKRLKDLEKRIKTMQQKMGEQERLLKMQARGLKNSESLKGDIVLLKQAKVKLLKQIKKDADDFRKLRTAKEREIHKLNKEKSRQKIKISKLQSQQDRQANVLKRRNEEIKAVQHRLKTVLNRQKERKEYLDGRVREKDQARWSRQIDTRLDISCELAQLKQEIGVQIKERKSLSEELSKCSDPKERETLEEARADASRKISELQSVIVEAEEEAKNVPGFRKPWADIRTTSTAKAVLGTMFSKLVSAANKKKEADKITRQTQEHVEELSRTVEEMKHRFEMQKASLQGEFDEKLLFLMQQIPDAKIEQKHNSESNPGCDLLQMQSKEIESLSAQNQRLVELLEAQSVAAKRKYLKEKKKKEEEAVSDNEEEEVIWLSNDSETEDDQGDEEDEDYIPTPMKRKRSSGVRAKAKEDQAPSVSASIDIVPETVRQHVETLKVKELKAALKVLGLAISGRKDDLKKRLLEEFANRVKEDKSYDCCTVFSADDSEVLPITVKSLPVHNKRDSVVQPGKETTQPSRSSFEPIYEPVAAVKRSSTVRNGSVTTENSMCSLNKQENKDLIPKKLLKSGSAMVKRKSTEKRSKPGAENSARLANKPDNKDTKRKETHKSESGTVKRNQQKSTEKRKATGTARGSNTSAEHKDDKKGATMKVKLEEWMAGKSQHGKKHDEKHPRIGNSLFKSRGIFRKNQPT